MIDKIRIQNFKCLRDVEVELGPLNVLIGPNDSGKTSFLDALDWLGKPTFPSNRDPFVWQRDKQRSIEFQVTGTTSVPFSYFLKVGRRDDITQEYVSVGNRQILNRQGGTPSVRMAEAEYIVEQNKNAIHQVNEYRRQNTAAPDDGLVSVAQLLASIRDFQFNPKEMRRPVQGPQNAEQAASLMLGSHGENLAAVLSAILAGPDRQATLDLERHLQEQIPTLKGVSTPPAEGAGFFQIHFTLNVQAKPPVTIPATLASDGAMLLLGYLSLVYGNAPQILLVEEPENGLHPSRLKFVLNLLRKISTGEIGSIPRQVIITTHSPLLLNFVEPSEVRIFRRDDSGGTNIKAMDKVPNIERLSKEFAPGELWYLYGEEDLVKGQAT